MNMQNYYQEKVELQFDQWDAEINLLKAKALNAEVDIVTKRLERFQLSST